MIAAARVVMAKHIGRMNVCGIKLVSNHSNLAYGTFGVRQII